MKEIIGKCVFVDVLCEQIRTAIRFRVLFSHFLWIVKEICDSNWFVRQVAIL